MRPSPRITTILATTLALASTIAHGAYLPAYHAARRGDAVIMSATLTLTSTTVVDATTTMAVATAVVDCVQAFCQDASSYCVYWAGVTGWDPSRGVVPGMTVVPFASCAGGGGGGGHSLPAVTPVAHE